MDDILERIPDHDITTKEAKKLYYLYLGWQDGGRNLDKQRKRLTAMYKLNRNGYDIKGQKLIRF